MMVPLILRPNDLHEGRREGTETSERKILLFTGAVLVFSTASVSALLLYLEQGMAASLTVGMLVGATAAIEVGWFGGKAFFGENGPDER